MGRTAAAAILLILGCAFIQLEARFNDHARLNDLVDDEIDAELYRRSPANAPEKSFLSKDKTDGRGGVEERIREDMEREETPIEEAAREVAVYKDQSGNEEKEKDEEDKKEDERGDTLNRHRHRHRGDFGDEDSGRHDNKLSDEEDKKEDERGDMLNRHRHRHRGDFGDEDGGRPDNKLSDEEDKKEDERGDMLNRHRHRHRGDFGDEDGGRPDNKLSDEEDDDSDDDGSDDDDSDDDDSDDDEAGIKSRNYIYSDGERSQMKSSTKRHHQSCEKGLCELNITPLGCFKDKHLKTRPLPLLVDSHRDPSSKAHHGSLIVWEKFDSSMKKLICECVKIARKKGFKHIGVQYFGECWSGNITNDQYAIDGKSTECVDGKFKPCKDGKLCIGKAYTNFVYKIEPEVPACKLGYKKVGCFYDPVKVKDRPMPVLLETQRDVTSKVYHGITLSWKEYHKSLKVLIDRCAKRARAKGYSFFGIQYYGECWSGPSAHKTYSKYGVSSHCVNADFQKCNPKYGCPCTGKQHANFVYKLL